MNDIDMTTNDTKYYYKRVSLKENGVFDEIILKQGTSHPQLFLVFQEDIKRELESKGRGKGR